MARCEECYLSQQKTMNCWSHFSEFQKLYFNSFLQTVEHVKHPLKNPYFNVTNNELLHSQYRSFPNHPNWIIHTESISSNNLIWNIPNMTIISAGLCENKFIKFPCDVYVLFWDLDTVYVVFSHLNTACWIVELKGRITKMIHYDYLNLNLMSNIFDVYKEMEILSQSIFRDGVWCHWQKKLN